MNARAYDGKIVMKLGKKFVLSKFQTNSKLGHAQSKNTLLHQIERKVCESFRGFIKV